MLFKTRLRRVVFFLTITLLFLSEINARSQKRRRSLSRRPTRSVNSDSVNILFVRATTVHVGFTYVQGAKRFYVSAREWVNGASIGNEAYGIWLRDQDRTATVRNLNPGREYMILVQAWSVSGKIGLQGRRVVRTSQQCYVCNGRPSNEACQGLDSQEECPHDKDACLNEVRYSKGVPKLTKRCTQWRPELGKQIQNGKDVTQACSGRENTKDAACKCMCRSNLCNEAEMPCINECFKELPIPDHSYMRCTNAEKIGSVCRWFCLAGFKVQGRRTSQCRADRTWSVLNPPECVPDISQHTPTHICPTLEPPENSFMSCTNVNNPGSVCTFSCYPQYFLEGSSVRTCEGSTSKWSGEQPSCVEIRCSKIEEVDGLSKECTNNETVGSICEFSCAAGRKFVGKRSLECLPGGRWSSVIPRCTAPDCAIEPKTFPNVVMECSPIPGRKSGKVCHFSCVEGYTRSGSKSSFCYNGNSWTSNSPTCKRLLCRPEMYAPPNGFVRCNDRSFYGSRCVFSCREGYMMQGRESTFCGNGGKWSSMDIPVCRKIKCPRINNFNGLYSCNDGQNYGSVCRFSCKRGFGFREGTTTKLKCVAKTVDEMEISRSQVNTGKWDAPIPKCIVVGCQPLGPAPPHSTVKCTGPQTRSGTICTYTCDKGYSLLGSARTTCVARSDGSAQGDWSSEPPTCERVTCEILPSVKFGTVQCTDENFAGSECEVECDYGRFVSGKKTISCGLGGSWSTKLAICRLVACLGKPILQNGIYNCGDFKRFVFNHECEASCNNGLELSMPGAAVCGVKGNWLTSEEVICKDINECKRLDESGLPSNGGCEQNCVNTFGSYRCECSDTYELNADGKTCRILICPSLEAVMKGRIACTNTNKISSSCTLRCVPGFETSEVRKVTCLRSGQWDKEMGTCTRISCHDIEIPSFGFMECSLGYKFGSNCDFECAPGFELRGKSSTRCGANGKWTYPAPVCEKKICDPTFLTIRNAIVKCSDKNRYESMCEAACGEGYELESTEDEKKFFTVKVHCLEDATWSRKKPKCVKKRCDPFYKELTRTRHNGTLTCTDGDWLDSTCELSCDVGYKVQGNFRIVCSGDAVWSKKLGLCTKIQCPALSSPRNGEMMCTEDTSYQSTCSFYCNDGYEMEGDPQTDCSHDRSWTKKTPTCNRIICAKSYMKLLKGSVQCTEDSYFGSVCEYQCDPGYEFVDTTTDIRKSFGAGLDEGVSYDIIRLSCLATGIWGGEKPACQRHECVPPSIVLREAEPNGNIQCSDGDKFESVCELSCSKGFEISGGRASTQCTENRNWKPMLGQCQRRRCPMFEPLINGAVQCSNANRFESRCLFGCFPGYKLIGSPVSYCQADRTFTHSAPRCEKILCSTTHTKLENGNATCTDGVRFESECVYVCNPGYEMEFDGFVAGDGDSVILKCQSTGRWGGKLPICRRRQCSLHDGAIAKARLNGNVQCSESFWYSSVCTVDCNVGYELVGPASTTCNSEADWEPAIGFCERRTCPAMESPTHGSMECTDKNKFESICSFKCSYGYELIGFEETECLAMEYFSSAAPVCKEILCPNTFLQIVDGAVTCSNENKLASRCLYKCDPGYQLTSESVDIVECLETYTWNGDKPQCERKVCPQGDTKLVRAAEFGTLTCTDSNKYQSICSVTCYPGYRLAQGGAFTECRANQEWGPELGHCIKITCEEHEPLENGMIECTDSLRFQSVCSFACEPGFKLTHTKTTTCQADRKFSVKPPKCKKIDCPSNHMRIHNGEVHCTEGNKFGSVCKYECNKGFERVTGSASAQCLSDRTWDADKTGCERVQCDANDILIVKAREHGEVRCTGSNFYESVCTVNCDKGYELVGFAAGTTRCNEFAQWDGELGYCTQILCAEYTAPSNGNMTCTDTHKYESECVFTCHTGYEMSGESSAVCQADRSWTNKPPSCEKIECSDANLFLEHGDANCTEGNKYLSVCWYGCGPGYEMDEDVPYAMCTSSRAWTRNKPNCVKRECNYGEEMITRALQKGGISCTDGVRYQSVCKLTCNEGYELVEGAGEIECKETATWNQNIGHCERIRCTALETPDNSRMDCTDLNKFESVCAFVCEDGYEMEGDPTSECLSNGSFSNPAPVCVKTKCTTDYLSLPYGFVDCTDEEYFMSVCSYQCMVGYRMSGNSPDVAKSECLSNRTWSIEIPICEKKTCPYDAPHLLKALEHGDIKCTEGNRFGSVCSVSCDLGYELTGSENTECTESATWSNDIGHCTKIQCDGLKTPSAAIQSCTDHEYFNSSCSFSCEGGYSFTEEDFIIDEVITLKCLATRTWTVPGSPPECVKSSCPEEFLNLVNGNITCSDGAFYGSQCIFKCDEGYELLEPGDDFDVTSIIVSCRSNATWDITSQPTCRRIKCEPDMVERSNKMVHGSIACSDGSNFESRCNISCHKGYQVVEGEITTDCLSDRTWAPLLGECDKISCPALTATDDSSLICSEKFRFKSQCRVICRPGFEIYDPENDYDADVGLECKADGDWCGDVPTCTRVKCPMEYLSLDGGSASCTNNNLFESKCKYTCDAGYQMTQGQQDVTQCTAHMTWSNPTPSCEKRRCPANDTSIKEAQMNGEVICNDENKFDSQCELQCAQGYELSGERYTTCQHTGDWSNGIGLCNKIRCGAVDVPPNAEIKCSDGVRYESFCTFSCKTGYMLTEGSVKAGNGIVCQPDGKWDGEIIKCEKISCPSDGYTNIDNGKVRCTDKNMFKSRCLFECDGGHELETQIDPEDRTSVMVNCTERGYWDVRQPPKCRPVQCQPSAEQLHEQLENGQVRCSRGSEFRSQCRVRCDYGYELTEGESISICGNDKHWGPSLGICHKITCISLEKPRNSRMVCDDGFRYMSQCVFDCLPGFTKVLHRKNAQGVATCRGDGTWAGQPPTCEKAKCDSTHLSLWNGRVLCSDRNFFESECEYLCDHGFELSVASSNIAKCREDRTWSIEKPSCQIKTCTSVYAANGYMNCTGSDYNAVCRLNCEDGHLLKGSGFSTCTDVFGETKWDPPLGFCEKIRCPGIPNILNGFAQCSDKNKYRSVCYVNCQNGFEVQGVFFSTKCTSDGSWSRQFQACERVTCDSSYLSVEYGSVKATDGNFVGSTLTYSCPNFGHKFTGSSEVTCLSSGKWSRQKPRCEKFTCAPLNLPNGEVVCTGKRYNDYKSTCKYSCNDNYERVGSATTECQLDGNWTSPPPYCKGHCDIKFASLEHGGVECTNKNYHHSRCRFWCNKPSVEQLDSKYHIFGNDFLTCREDGLWDGMPPCCSQNCIPFGKMDLFFVFHSGSVRYHNWEKQLQFATQILDNFQVGEENVLAGALRYNRDVDVRSEIPIGKFKTKTDLTRAIKFMPSGGWGTRTGQALEHIVTKSTLQPGNRADVADTIILFVHDTSQDDVKSATEKLRANNITVHIVGIETESEKLDLSHLMSLASKPVRDHVSIVQDGFAELTTPLSKAFGEKLCQNPCLHNKEYREYSQIYIGRHGDSSKKLLQKSDFLI